MPEMHFEVSGLMSEILNNELETFTAWSKQWLVNFTPSKTVVMLFSYYNRNRPHL